MKTIEIDEKQPKTCLESLIMQLGPDMLRTPELTDANDDDQD